MKKILLLFMSIIILSACSKDRSEVNDNINNASNSTKAINPPAWIQGTWGYYNEYLSQDIFTFSSDDICLISFTSSACFKGIVSKEIPEHMKILSQKATDNTYEIVFSDYNEITRQSFSFRKKSNNEIEWENVGFGNISEHILTRKK